MRQASQLSNDPGTKVPGSVFVYTVKLLCRQRALYNKIMNEILHANLFFIIASLATICFSILVCVFLYHVIKIVKAIRRIVDRVEAGSEVLADDLEELRVNLNPAKVFGFIMNIFSTRKSRKNDDE